VLYWTVLALVNYAVQEIVQMLVYTVHESFTSQQ